MQFVCLHLDTVPELLDVLIDKVAHVGNEVELFGRGECVRDLAELLDGVFVWLLLQPFHGLSHCGHWPHPSVDVL